MNAKVKKVLSCTGLVFVATMLAGTLAQRATAQDYDPPSRVARLNYLRGPVSFQPAGETDWAPAVVNRPMTTGDRLWADDDARAEMHLGSATIRLDAGTGFSFLNLDDHTTQIQLSGGTISIRVDRLDHDEVFEVDTPNQAFSILQPGDYRIQASGDGNSTLVTVRDGSGEVTGGGRTYSIESELSGEFTGTDTLYANIFRADALDEFDRWGEDRDRREDESRSTQYVSRDVVGYEDLDDNGSWRSDPDYGDVWVPRVAAGWAPYRDGHWAWISPWGWTWVDDAPWGYAPFHYGRWVYARNSWCWVPGPIAVRPVYAPALVVFVGGPRFNLSLSFGGGQGGNVGWFPLGPREVYVPGYHASREYMTRVNVSNTTVNNTTIVNIYNRQVANNSGTDNRGDRRGNERDNSEVRYINRTAPGGVTAVSQSTFTNSQSVGKAKVTLDPRDIETARISNRAEVAPTRTSVFGGSSPTGNRVARPSSEVANRSVVAKTPPPPPPVPFERQLQELAVHPGQPLARTEVEGLRPANLPSEQPRVRQAPVGRPASADSDQSGKRFGNSQLPNVPASDVNPNPPGRNDRPDRGNRDQRGYVQPSAPPPANAIPNPPVNNAPPARNDRSDRGNQDQRGNIQPSAPPLTNVNPKPPVNNVPPVRSDRPDRGNQDQRGNIQPSAPPLTNVNPKPPVNDVPPVRSDRPDRGNRDQRGNIQPSAPPPTNVTPNPPLNNAPPARNDRPDRGNRDQRGNIQPSAPPPTNVTPNPPVNNAPPARNDGRDRGNQGQRGNASPSALPATNVTPKPPAKEQTPQKANDKDESDKQKGKDDQHSPR